MNIEFIIDIIIISYFGLMTLKALLAIPKLVSQLEIMNCHLENIDNAIRRG